jgi:excisionase family DNA binding protein
MLNSNTEQITMPLPTAYRVEDIQRILGIGRSSAYSLIHQNGFPSIRVGTRVIIPADLFHSWINTQAGKGAVTNGKG